MAETRTATNVFRDLKTADLKRMINTELQKIPASLESIPSPQRKQFIAELAITIKNVQAWKMAAHYREDEARKAEVEAQELNDAEKERLQKEEEEKTTKSRNETLAVAIELAVAQAAPTLQLTDALVGSLAQQGLITAINQTTSNIQQRIEAYEAGRTQRTSEFATTKQAIITQGFSAPDHARKEVLLANVLADPAASAQLAAEFGIPQNQLHKLKIEGDDVVLEEDSHKRLPFTSIANRMSEIVQGDDLHTAIKPVNLENSQIIGLKMQEARAKQGLASEVDKEIAEGEKKIAELKRQVLKDNGVESRPDQLDKQWAALQNKAEKDPNLAAQIQKVADATALTATLQATNEVLKQSNAADANIQHVSLLADIEKGVTLRKVDTADRAIRDADLLKQLYLEEKAQQAKAAEQEAITSPATGRPPLQETVKTDAREIATHMHGTSAATKVEKSSAISPPSTAKTNEISTGRTV